jgi:hypothetical protein
LLDCSLGTWGIGLGTRRVNLSKVPLGTDGETWTMDQYGQVKHDNKVLSQFRTAIEEGDVIVRIDRLEKKEKKKEQEEEVA